MRAALVIANANAVNTQFVGVIGENGEVNLEICGWAEELDGENVFTVTVPCENEIIVKKTV